MPPAPPVYRALQGSLLRLLDDVQGLLTGCALTALALLLFQGAQLVPGGTVGLALLLQRGTGLPLPLAFPLVVAPFYLLALWQMGRGFTIRTALSVALVTGFTAALPHGLRLDSVQPWLAGGLGGLLAGVGILILFRHRASLGGFNVLALLAHQKLGWKTGVVQAGLDAVVVLLGAVLGDPRLVGWSLLSVFTLNFVLVANHRARAAQA
jgi:uncharacterized membrane-anchored protein YitT (DUF2179 family)